MMRSQKQCRINSDYLNVTDVKIHITRYNTHTHTHTPTRAKFIATLNVEVMFLEYFNLRSVWCFLVLFTIYKK